MGNETKLVKRKCKRCYGTGHWSGRYGQTACEDCNMMGYTFQKVEVKQKKSAYQLIEPSKVDKPLGEVGKKPIEDLLINYPTYEENAAHQKGFEIGYNATTTKTVDVESVEQAGEKYAYKYTDSLEPDFAPLKNAYMAGYTQSTEDMVKVIHKRIDEIERIDKIIDVHAKFYKIQELNQIINQIKK